VNNLSSEQRTEVIELISQNNSVLMSSFKDSMHEILDPLKNDINKAIGNHHVLVNEINETKKKIEQLFIFHNNSEKKFGTYDLSLLSATKDISKLQTDINSLGVKMTQNETKDNRLTEDFDKLKSTVNEYRASYSTLVKLGGFIGTVLALIIAYMGLNK